MSVWFKCFNLKLQIPSAYQSKARDEHLTLSHPLHKWNTWMDHYGAERSCENPLAVTSKRRPHPSFLFSPMRIFLQTQFIRSCIFSYIHIQKQQMACHWLPSITIPQQLFLWKRKQLLYTLLRYYKPYTAKITKNTCSKLTGTFIFRTYGIWHLHPNRFTNFSLT